jgi:hypothetical protein
MRQAPLQLRWLLFTLLACFAFGFSTRRPFGGGGVRFATLLAASDDGFTIPDHKGNAIGVGSIVRVVVSGIKAYQVQPKGFGSFSEDGTFCPAEKSGASRGTKNLQLPIGLTGIVTKIYDEENHVSANHPIQAKFTPDAPHVEKYNPTVPFLMHFSPQELECVVEKL